jgi:alkanesulfonate monooxygenase SsuD/methylene tetrahydromethanopterin reductase-like flavin-dependent oxidoreductase (luciferase family)
MHRSIVFATSVWEPLPALTLAAESSGFSRVWTTEGPRRDALARAAALAAISSTIGVGTGITFAFGRTPLTAAGTALDIGLLSGGRFTLGLGAGTRGVRRQYGVEVEKPAPWMEEYVGILRRAFDPEVTRIEFEGEYFRTGLGAPPITPEGPNQTYTPPPIYGAAINPIMIKRVAKVFDGLALLSIGVGEGYFDRTVLPAFQKGREEAGRPASGGFACWCIASVDSDRELARARAKHQLAFYFSTPSYGRPAEEMGFGAAAEAIRTAARASQPPDWDKVAESVPEEMVDALCLAGTPDEVRNRIAVLEARLEPEGVDELALQLPSGGLGPDEFKEACTAVIEALAPATVAA